MHRARAPNLEKLKFRKAGAPLVGKQLQATATACGGLSAPATSCRRPYRGPSPTRSQRRRTPPGRPRGRRRPSLTIYDLKVVRSKKRAVFSEHLAERPGRPTRPSWTLGFVAGADEPGGAPVCAEEQQSVRRPGSRKAQQELEQQRADRSRDERATPETKEAALQRDTERGEVALQQHLMSRDKARLWLRRREQDLEQQVAAVAQERGAFAATLAGRGEALAGVSTGMSARRSSAASTATSGPRRPRRGPRGDARRASSSGCQRS